jgi:hypothetical protein
MARVVCSGSQPRTVASNSNGTTNAGTALDAFAHRSIRCAMIGLAVSSASSGSS